MTKILTIDMDNVLCGTGQAFLQFYHEQYGGEQIPFSDLHHAMLQDDMSLFPLITEDFETVYHRFITQYHDLILPIAGAQEGIKKIKNLGYTLYVLTGRSIDREPATPARVETYFPGMFEEIVYTNHLMDTTIPKGEIVKRLDAVLHIDDYHVFARTVTDTGYKVLLYDSPWNRAEPETELLQRVMHRDDIYTIVEQAYGR